MAANPIPALDLSKFQASVPRSDFLARTQELKSQINELTGRVDKLEATIIELTKSAKPQKKEQAKPEKRTQKEELVEDDDVSEER